MSWGLTAIEGVKNFTVISQWAYNTLIKISHKKWLIDQNKTFLNLSHTRLNKNILSPLLKVTIDTHLSSRQRKFGKKCFKGEDQFISNTTNSSWYAKSFSSVWSDISPFSECPLNSEGNEDSMNEKIKNRTRNK